MSELVLLVGLQGAGKSTLYAQRFAATHELVSLDRLRNNRRPRRRQLALLEEALSRGASVVVDNTNPTREERAPLVACARAQGARVVAYVFDVPLDEARARNARREGRARVPDVALFVTAKKLEPPTLDEGFDAVVRVRVRVGGGFELVPADAAATPGAEGATGR
jgi:predicted kinase